MSCKWCTTCDEKNCYSRKFNIKGVSRFKIDGIIKHAKSKSHKKAMKIVKTSEKKIIEGAI
jgi:hypothetical protein